VIPVVTPAEMAAADARTIAAGTPEPVLMTRAGRAVAWRVRRVLGGSYGRRVVLLCGSGNNGGDGRITAATLRAWGARADVVEVGRNGAADPAVCTRLIARADAVVDGIVGTGFAGAITGALADLVDAVNAAPVVRVAIDIPSGVDGLTGEVRGAAIDAHHTVTFAAPKPGLWFHPGRARSGTVTVADIGIDLGPDAFGCGILTDADVAELLPAIDPRTHKWRAGVLVVGGSAGMTGAPMLAAHAAAHLGAGIVIAALPGGAATQASGSEVITRALPATAAGTVDPAGLGALHDDLGRFGAVVLGPGLGRAASTAAVVTDLLAAVEAPLVLDADGLVALGGDLAPLRARRAPTVLTPHDGEFASLTGDRPGPDRVAAARDLAAATGAVVLLKGPTTVVAAPSGRARLNPTGTPALATAGSGDVLAGVIGAFCAQGMKCSDAAAAAAYVHGRAAERAGHTGLVATDLPALAGAARESLRRGD
jgi:hydroxyethylthiazole kinase-like uncharacterized protein yjeF